MFLLPLSSSSPSRPANYSARRASNRRQPSPTIIGLTPFRLARSNTMQRTIRFAILIASLVVALQLSAAAKATGSFDKTLTVSGAPDVEIVTGSGHIHVRAGDASSISIHARIEAGSNWFSGGDGLSPEE